LGPEPALFGAQEAPYRTLSAAPWARNPIQAPTIGSNTEKKKKKEKSLVIMWMLGGKNEGMVRKHKYSIPAPLTPVT